MKKLAVILLAVVMALGMAIFAACADKPAEEPSNPNTPGTEQPADPDQPLTEEQMRAKLAEFKTYLTTDHESFSVSSEMLATDPDDGDSSVKVSVDVTKTKIRAAFTAADDEGEMSGDSYYVYDEANELWYVVNVHNDETSEKAELIFDNASSVDYVIDDVIGTRYASVDTVLEVMDEAVVKDGALVYSDGYGTIKLSFADSAYVLEVSIQDGEYGISIKLTFRTSAIDFDIPAAVTEAIDAVTADEITLAKRLNEFEKGSANVTVVQSGTGVMPETKTGFIGGGEYSLYSDDNQYSVVRIGEQNIRIEQSGEDNLRVSENYSSSDTETIRGMLYAEHIFSFINSSDNEPLLCLKEGSDGKIVTLNERGRQVYAGDAIVDLEIDYSIEDTIVMTIKELVGEDGEWNTVVTLTNVGETITPDYAPSVEYVKARVVDNVYYMTAEVDGVKYAGAAQVFGYDEIVDIKSAIAVGNDSYTVTVISPYLLENNYNAIAVAVPYSVTVANYFADEGGAYKIYYKASEVREDVEFARSKKLLVYLYSETEPTGKGYFWHYAEDNTIEEYKSANLFTITFHGYDDEYCELEVTEDGFVLGTVPDPYGEDGKSFVGWYYDKDTWEDEFDPDDVGKVTANFDVYARFEKTYRVEFETAHGFVSSSGNRYYVIENEPVPQDAGYIYEFEGWYFDADFTRKATFPLTLTEDTVLYAKWTQSEYGYVSIPDTDGTTVSYALMVYNGDGKDVVIPETYKGLPVSTISIDCFNGVEEKIQSLTILGNIGNLGNLTSGAFMNLTNLVKVTIGANITDIGGEIAYYAENGILDESEIFANCYSIKEVRILSTELKTAIESGVRYTFGGLLRNKYDNNEMDVYYDTATQSKITEEGCYVFRTDGMNRKWIIKYLPELAEDKANVTIPTLYGIDAYAFYNRAEIKTVTFGNVNYIKHDAFNGVGITSLVIPDGTTFIGDYAFGNCRNLLTVTFGTGMRNLTTEAFKDSDNLVEVINRSTRMTVAKPDDEYEQFGHALVVKNDANATSSLVYADNGCVTLTAPGEDEEDTRVYLVAYLVDYEDAPASVVIPEGVTDIRDGIFAGDDVNNYKNIKTVTLPSTLLYIGNFAFDYSGLTSLTIPSGVTEIGNYAFNKTAITEIDIPVSVGVVGLHAFDIPTLTHVTVNGVIANISAETFGSEFDGYNWTSGCAYLGNASNPNIILVKVDNGSRSYVLLGSSVKQIANYAFKGCDKLSSFAVPNSVEYIGAYAFDDCTSLYKITLGTGVGYIGNNAFRNCYKLYEVINYSTLNITSFSSNYGEIARHALNVSTDGTSIITKTADGFVFMTRTLKVGAVQSEAVNTELYFLVAYDGDGGEITLPANFNGNKYRVYGFAFTGRTDVTKITIDKNAIAPEQLNVSSIPYYSIENSAFWLDNGTKLAIEFNGTQEEWGAISKYDYSDGTGTWYGTTKVTVTCSDGTIEL